jgi:deoxycytidine triphosphate deaminase
LVEELWKDGVACSPPPSEDQIGPGSLDLKIGKICTFIEGEREIIEPNCLPPIEFVNLRKKFILEPGESVLITAREKIFFPTHLRGAGLLTNKSSWARKGLSIATQMITSGYRGRPTFSVTNYSKFPVVLKKNDRIAQMVFAVITESPWFKASLNPKPDTGSPSYYMPLTLGNEFVVFKNDLKGYETIIVSNKDGYLLRPGEFVLGITREKVCLRSSGYVALLSYPDGFVQKGVHIFEGLLNPGYIGKITLEIKSIYRPVILYPGTEIYRAYFFPAYTFGSYAENPRSQYVGDEKTDHPQT